MHHRHRGLRIGLMACAAALGSGCAAVETRGWQEQPEVPVIEIEPTVVGTPTAYRDPLIWMNRGIFAFNDVAYRYLLFPLAKGYLWLMPDPLERGVSNFFHNLKTPIYVVNDILQLQARPLGHHLLRFVLNTTVGVLGFFDPAEAWLDIPADENRFEDTLAHYGAGYGIYLVLPIIGPADARNGLSRVTDYFLDPVPYLTDNPETTAIQLYDGFHEFAPGAPIYEKLRDKADDRYLFFRNLYLQGVQRDARR